MNLRFQLEFKTYMRGDTNSGNHVLLASVNQPCVRVREGVRPSPQCHTGRLSIWPTCSPPEINQATLSSHFTSPHALTQISMYLLSRHLTSSLCYPPTRPPPPRRQPNRRRGRPASSVPGPRRACMHARHATPCMHGPLPRRILWAQLVAPSISC